VVPGVQKGVFRRIRAGPGPARSIPTFSSVAEVWSLVGPKVKTDWMDLRQSPHAEKTPRVHREPPSTITSGLLPSRWKALVAFGTHPHNTLMKFG